MNNRCIQIFLMTILLVSLSGSNAEQVEEIRAQEIENSLQVFNESEIFVVTVDSTNLRFTPESITVTEKDSVRFFWTNQLLPHNAVERNGLFDSGEAARNVDYTYTFEVGENGTYEYICEPHEAVGMIGTIIVEPLGGEPGTTQNIGMLATTMATGEKIFKDKDGLLKTLPGGLPEPDQSATLLQKHLEGSNINAVEEMIVSLDQQRQFELNVKLIKIAKDLDEAATNLMRMPQ